MITDKIKKIQNLFNLDDYFISENKKLINYTLEKDCPFGAEKLYKVIAKYKYPLRGKRRINDLYKVYARRIEYQLFKVLGMKRDIDYNNNTNKGGAYDNNKRS